MADPYRTSAVRAGRRPSLYVPEENQEWQEGQKLIGPEAAWRRNYDFVLQQTGDPQRAEAAANSIARTERRQELTQLTTGVAGPVLRGGEKAVGLAKQLMGGTRAAEVAAPKMLALPAPRSGPSSPVGRGQSGEAIPMGRPPVNPKEDFRQVVNADYGVKPRAPYDNKPVIDETFTLPEQLNASPVVRTAPSRRQILNSESPRSDVQLGNTQANKRKELTWQNLMDDMRADTDGMAQKLARPDMPQVSTSPLVKLAEAKTANRTLTPAEVGGSESPFLTRPAPGVKRQAPAAAEPAPPVRETQMAPAEYPVQSQFSVADPRMMTAGELQGARGAFAGPEVPPVVAQRQRIASQISAEETRRLAEQQLMAQRQRLAGAIDEASLARPAGSGPMLQPPRGAPPIGAMGPLGAGAAVTALGLGSQTVQDDRARQAAINAAMERQRIDDLDAAGGVEYRSATQQPFAGTDFFAPSPAPEPFTTTDFFAPSPAVAIAKRQIPASDYDSIQGSDPATRPVGGKSAPLPPRRPDDLPRQEPGILSRIFSGKDYQSQGGELRQDGKINWGNPESSADFFRADKARRETPDAVGLARGGAANASPTKEALLHKSLEIIHHMIRSR
jgi:hypothetical protein